MRTEVIKEFLVFARHLNFSRAAAELHITQPNLSKHMADLEREVGVELIDRRKHGKNRPVLSQAGKYFFEEMSYLDTSFQTTLERCRAIGRQSTHDIRIQELWQNNAMTSLYSMAGAFQTSHPNNTVRYMRLSQRRPIESLLEGESDVVLDVWCGPRQEHCRDLAALGVHTVHIITEPPVIWYQEGNQHVAGKEEVLLEDLLDIPVIMTRGGTHDYMVASWADYCERNGLSARLRHLQPADNTPTGMFMSDFHDGVLMTTPAMINDPRLRSRADLHWLEIDDPRIAVAFILAARASDKEACAFLDYVREHRTLAPQK